MKCPICEREFIGRRNKIYCSPTCKQRNKRRNRRTRRMKQFIEKHLHTIRIIEQRFGPIMGVPRGFINE